MDPKELRDLCEAYSEVYAPQEEIEEGLRSAVRNLLGGGKKEETPKPESRGAELRRKYKVGPEKSDTSAKRQILDRSRAKAERDEKEYGGSKYSKSVAQKSKAAHDRYLKAGYSKYGADDARGSGNKARKRAAALSQEDFNWIVDTLLDEGYDLSTYTVDELYDMCIDEAVKGESSERRKDLAAERRAGHKPKSAKEGENYASHKLAQMAYAKRKRMGEEVEQIDEISAGLAGKVVNARIERTGAAADREMRARTPQNVRDTVAAADKEAKARKLAAGVRARRAANEEVEQIDEVSKTDDTTRSLIKQYAGKKGISFEPGPRWDPSANRGKGANLSHKQVEKQRRKALRSEDVEIFDVVLEFLQAEGYAETLEEAEWLMANVIDEEAIEIILGEEQLDEISQKLATKAYAQSATGEFEGHDDARDIKRTDNLRKHIKRKFGDKAAEDADRHADSETFGRKDPRTGKRQPKPESRFQNANKYRTRSDGKMHGQDQNKLKAKLKRRIGEEYMDEAQEARNNPEKYEAGQKKKSAPVRGEKTPMPPRGDKRREDFEKWYAANVR